MTGSVQRMELPNLKDTPGAKRSDASSEVWCTGIFEVCLFNDPKYVRVRCFFRKYHRGGGVTQNTCGAWSLKKARNHRDKGCAKSTKLFHMLIELYQTDRDIGVSSSKQVGPLGTGLSCRIASTQSAVPPGKAAGTDSLSAAGDRLIA